MNKEWWVVAIQWIVWGIIMAIVMSWLGRSRFKTQSEVSLRQLHHPKSTLIIGLVCFIFFVSIAIISNVYANKTTTWWTTVIFVGLALLGVPIIIDYFMARHEVFDEGLNYGSLIGKRGYLNWVELECVQYSPTMKWFRLETHSGKVARVSAMLIGLPEFAKVLLRRAPPNSIDDYTWGILQATAEGNLPPVW